VREFFACRGNAEERFAWPHFADGYEKGYEIGLVAPDL
jgi:hypothetical protein